MRGRQPPANYLLHYLFFLVLWWASPVMLSSSTAALGVFQDKAKEAFIALVALAGGHGGTRQEKAPLLYFFSLLSLCKKPSNSILQFVKEFCFGYMGGCVFQYRQMIRQTGDLYLFFALSWPPAGISISPSVLLCHKSGGTGERVFSCPSSRDSPARWLLMQACSHQAI